MGVALTYTTGEWSGRRWSSWKQMDDRAMWLGRVKEGEREQIVDLVVARLKQQVGMRDRFVCTNLFPCHIASTPVAPKA